MNIDKRALREVAERAKDRFIPNFRAPTRDVLALLDENIQLQREKDAIEAVALALRDDMRQAREQLEEAEHRMAEQSAIVAAAEKLVRCKGRYHSELNYRALAKLFGVITPDLPPLEHENVHYADAAEVEITALRQRIAELERSETQLINERDCAESALNDAYKAVMGQAPEWSNWFSFENAIDEIELACEQWRNQTDDVIQFRQRIQELEARQIALPQRLSPEGYHIDEAYMVDDDEGEYLDRDAVIEAIRTAGIKVEGE